MMHGCLILTGLMAALTLLAQQQGGGANQPGTRWTDEQLRQAVDVARVGRKLTPKSWPAGARVAVCLSFDDDTEAPLCATTSATTLSASDSARERHAPHS